MGRPEAVFASVLVPAAAEIAVIGQVQYDLFTDDDSGPIWIAMVMVGFGVSFMPIAIIAIWTGFVGRVTALVAFGVGVAGLVAVPWLVRKSIEGDDSSTASLVHIWDPVLVAIPVGLVLLVGWAARRLSGKDRASTQAAAAPRTGP